MLLRGFRLEHVLSTATTKQMWQRRLEDLNSLASEKTSVSYIIMMIKRRVVCIVYVMTSSCVFKQTQVNKLYMNI